MNPINIQLSFIEVHTRKIILYEYKYKIPFDIVILAIK